MNQHPEHPDSPSSHQHQETRELLHRMSRAIGHMEAIKRMVEEGRDCPQVLIQLAAVRSAIGSIGRIVLKDHITNCVVDAAQSGDERVLKELDAALDQFLK